MPIPLLLHGKHGPPTVTYQPFGPWLVPWRLTTAEEEYRTLTTGVGLADVSILAAVECRGEDRVAFLQRLLTNDLASLAPGHGCRAALLTPQARVLAHLLVLVEADAVWLLGDLTRMEIVLATLERHHFSEQVTFANHERREAALALQGPRALETLARLAGRELALPQAGDHVRLTLGGIPVRLVRHSLVGRGLGLLCLVEAARAQALWDGLASRGCARVGWEALNALRVEAGEAWDGMDVTEANLLPETGWETVAASDTKGCYVGQEIVARLRTYGSPNKRLIGLLLEGPRGAQPGDRIERDGDALGTVTSAAWSFALKRPIALGYVKRGADTPGARVELVGPDARVTATVAARPLTRENA